MLRHPRHEKLRSRQRDLLRPVTWRWGQVLVLVLAVLGVSSLQAQGNKAQRAIEKLEACSAQERKEDCIKILKNKSSGASKYAVKAQVRGGRIIWYEYDAKADKARRTN